MMQRCIIIDFVITDASEYLKQLTGEKSVRAIALRIGVAPTTIGRQIEAELRPELVVKICRQYGRPVLPELVAIGFITENEAMHTAMTSALAAATDEQLAQEILDRVRGNTASALLTEPISTEQSNVARLDDHRGRGAEEHQEDLAAAASEREFDREHEDDDSGFDGA